MATTFESLLPLDLAGTLSDIIVFEDSPINVSQIIRTTQNWGVKVSWEMSGAAANFFLLMGENWHVRLQLESIGTEAEYNLPPGSPLVVSYASGIPITPTVRRWSDINLDVPAGTVAAGVYKMTLTVQLADPTTPPIPRAMVAFSEGTLIQLYDATTP